MEILDYGVTEEEKYKLSSIGSRFGAMILDSILMGILVLPVMVFNMFNLRNSVALIIISFLAMLYKPFMEYRYGATLGKMAPSIKVIAYSGESITLRQAILRSLFNLISSTLGLVSMALVLVSGIQYEGIIDYTKALQETSIEQLSSSFNLLVVADYIPAFFDKQRRCLHDRIAQTLVVKSD